MATTRQKVTSGAALICCAGLNLTISTAATAAVSQADDAELLSVFRSAVKGGAVRLDGAECVDENGAVTLAQFRDGDWKRGFNKDPTS